MQIDAHIEKVQKNVDGNAPNATQLTAPTDKANVSLLIYDLFRLKSKTSNITY